MIPAIDPQSSLDQCAIDTLVNTQSTLDWYLSQPSVDSRLILIDAESQWTLSPLCMEWQLRYWLSVSWVSIKISIKCQLSVDHGSFKSIDQQSTADPFLTWKIYVFVFKEKLLWKLKEMISVLYMLSCLLHPTMFWLQYSVPAVCLAFFQLTLGNCGKHFHWVSKVDYKTRTK